MKGPDWGAVQENQTEAPPGWPAWFGSPGSFEAPTLEAVTDPETPASDVGDANASFAGVVNARFQFSVQSPRGVHCALDATAIQIVVPDCAPTLTRLVAAPPESSLNASEVSEETESPA